MVFCTIYIFRRGNSNNAARSGGGGGGNRGGAERGIAPAQQPYDNNGGHRSGGGGGRSGGGGTSFNGAAFTESQLMDEVPKKKFTGRCRLFVGNLPNEVKETELKELFSPHGDIAECYLSGKGFAFLRLVSLFKYFLKLHLHLSYLFSLIAAKPRLPKVHI